MLAHWTQNDLLVNGVRLHYYRTGHGDKPPLVLVLGGPASTAREAPIKQRANSQQPPDHGAAQRQVGVPLTLA
jgi:pimeloyl-ACP methyl ester carboxylesterase